MTFIFLPHQEGVVSLLAQTEHMYTGEYLVSPQLLWYQRIRASDCLSFKELLWFMCLMTPSSQSIVKNLSNVKIAEFPLSNWTVSWWISLPAAHIHHSLTVPITQLASAKPSAISWPFSHAYTTDASAACCQVCVPITHWQELMVLALSWVFQWI